MPEPSNREFEEEPSSAQELRDILTARPVTIRNNPKMMHLVWPFFFAIALMLGSLLLFYGVLFPGFTGWLWQSVPGEGSPARLLLEGYRRWYWALLAVCGGGCLLNGGMALLQLAGAVGHLRTSRRIGKEIREALLQRLLDWEWRGDPEEDEPEFTPEELQWCREAAMQRELHSSAGGLMAVGVFLSLMAAAVLAACLLTENILTLPGKARADLDQLRTGQWENVVVWISPKRRSARLPGPWTTGQPELTTRYGMISEETGGEWTWIYVPQGDPFALDQDRLYAETETVCWNWENAQLYYVGYTTNFHLAAEITPVPASAMEGVAKQVLPQAELEHLNLI